jgi:cell division septation protein DedD
MLRDARKIRPRWELALDGRHIALLLALELVLLVGAFAAGYLLARPAAPALASAPASLAFRDPLASLDRDVPQVDLTFHTRLTEPRPDSATAEASPAGAVARRDRKNRPIPRALAEAQALEERARAIVARPRSDRTRVSAASAAWVAQPSSATSGNTDEELRRAMQGARAPDRSPSQPAAPSRADKKAGSAPTPGGAGRVSAGEPAAVTRPSAAAAPAGPKAHRARAARPSAKPGSARYTLQVRAFPERDKAEELVEHLRQRGLDAFLAEGQLPGRGRWFRVRVGHFSSKREAERYRERFVAQQKADAFVTLLQ